MVVLLAAGLRVKEVAFYGLYRFKPYLLLSYGMFICFIEEVFEPVFLLLLSIEEESSMLAAKFFKLLCFLKGFSYYYFCFSRRKSAGMMTCYMSQHKSFIKRYELGLVMLNVLVDGIRASCP